ncbi:MAG: tRNA (adenosine(37)-N6)-threonylcarbamoyltransferase complex ATPase subunit type 1 TsaE [cyanobacterium endosymbiont of Rhopalodia musculus]|uniref:tRNA (adenosine(37)-N6)-threonylcarbamoyltransferase complex ATPase subunit type 1 TsaE n=1 Tax=cyanobacterium endosymbiont of Epithemia clementina EcSB TaxID=3034674 RepID=UPI002480BB70|nr:tRNA (adenosine(37)-N6)-threonylcarbamoyltransferase complex ATPase subunit type 1 TsaE [cyanobacterium endosymbiont of Epithemia clementina EcSB]WGT67467.1 tRNA (adenosine(37)-N6)-threonylcarbamoyltransferase complex ATPase subunit type 1 TsaE [cyanobacterium endosymbiont of Epithemia clementina EcSB]
MIIELPSTKATLHLGEQLGKLLPVRTVLLLKGNLGAGKTTLVQGIGKGLSITEPIVSPTFTLVNEYTQGRLRLYHLDLYRLKPQEVEKLYPELYWEYQEVAPGITAIEWAQRLPYQPSDYLEIQLVNLPKLGRQAILKEVGSLSLKASFWESLR